MYAGLLHGGQRPPGVPFLLEERGRKEGPGAARAFSMPYPPPPGPRGTGGRRYGSRGMAGRESRCSSYRSGGRTTSAIAPRHMTGQDLIVAAFYLVQTSRHKVCTFLNRPCARWGSARTALAAARRHEPALLGIARVGAPRQRNGVRPACMPALLLHDDSKAAG